MNKLPLATILVLMIFLLAGLTITAGDDPLQPSHNAPLINTITKILNQYEYTRTTAWDEFDCTDRSQLVWDVLDDNNFDPKMMVGNSGRDWHMWIGVPDWNNDWIMVETTWSDTRLGEVVQEDDFFEPFMIVDSPHAMEDICSGDTGGIVNASRMEWAKETLIRKR